MKLSFPISRLYIVDRQWLARQFLFWGLFVAYLGSLHPWFFWPMKEMYVVPATLLLMVGLVLTNSTRESYINRQDFVIPFFLYFFASFCMLFVNEVKITSYLQGLFTLPVFYVILRIDPAFLRYFMDRCAKLMAACLLISLLAWLAHFVGIGIAPRNAAYLTYSFDNYLLFMVDDRFLLTLVPRFSSVFLEPGHIGSATALLLMTQFGHWKRWYNVVLIIVTLFTLSLAAYAIIISLAFFNLWVQRKRIFMKVVALSMLLGGVTVGALFYNGGENMLHDAILLRLEVDDETGDIAGNNRVSESFEQEFDSFLTSSDIFFGRDMNQIDDEHGNSGYRVFIYDFGLISTILVFLFYVTSFRDFSDTRMLFCAIFISVLIFWIRGYPLWYSNFIPLLVTVMHPKIVNKQ